MERCAAYSRKRRGLVILLAFICFVFGGASAISRGNETTRETEEKPIKILCWVLTQPTNHHTHAKAVIDTWGSQCDRLIFMSSEDDPSINAVKLAQLHESRIAVWTKTRLAWIFCYTHLVNDYDWFLKADDDTYVVMPNLRKALSKFDSNQKHYIGRDFMYPFGNQIYAAGGAGYLLSKASLLELAAHPHVMPTPTSAFEMHEDYEMGVAMSQLGIPLTNPIGDDGLETFLPLEISYLRTISHENYKGFWYWDYSRKAKDLELCCSRFWITSHYVDVSEMHILHARVLTGAEARGKLPSELDHKPTLKLPYEP